MNLSDLKVGQSAVVKGFLCKDSMRIRLIEMGFTEGAKVKCTMVSPLGDPTAFFVCGAVIALRKNDAKNVICSA